MISTVAPLKISIVSVIIPAYCSSKSLPELVSRVFNVLTNYGCTFEIIIVDDASPDDTWQVLKELKINYPHLKILRLLKNAGQHNAILCGFSFVKGEVIITMDDDLQNPPEEIPKILDAILLGYDIAIGAYDIKQHSASRNLGGKLIDYIQKRIFHLPKDFHLTSFRGIRKVVVDNVLQMGGVYPYVTSMLLSHTKRYVNVPVHHAPRAFGKSQYKILGIVRLAFNLLFNYTYYPLYFIISLCIIALGTSFGLGVFVFWKGVINNGHVPGWASTLFTISFFSGLIILILVIHSIFLHRINQQITRSRLNFTISEMHE